VVNTLISYYGNVLLPTVMVSACVGQMVTHDCPRRAILLQTI